MDSAKRMRIALAGNPNCGKTTVFNAYTGSRQHVGNYPGVTVDKKEGEFEFNGHEILLVDLPGTYSLTPYSMEEIVVRREMRLNNMQSVIDVVDASALERNLLLTVQILEMGIPLVLACNMMDEAEAAGIHIDMPRLSKLLQIPVVSMTAKNGTGLKEAMKEAINVAEHPTRGSLRLSYGPDLDMALLEMEKIIEKSQVLAKDYNPRFVAVKFLENDREMIQAAQKGNSEAAKMLEAITAKVSEHVRRTFNTEIESLITDHRYGFINSILKDGVVARDPEKDRLAMTDKIDKVLTNAFFGPLIMLAVLYLMYQITFEVGAYPQEWVEVGFALLGDFVGALLPEGLLQSLIVDGMIAGVGGVLSFVPLIMIMFALISFMEDSGYMARMAFMMDRIFRFFGLHGASVMPYVISGGIAGGCAIPGAMATRTLRSPKEKLATLLTLPYMTCGAKLPLLLLLAGAFFPENAATVMFCIMLAGWIFALVIARFLRSTIVRGEATPFVMELPPYRLPTLFSVILHCWERAWQYIKKAGTVILAISVIIWAAMTFPQLPDDMAKPFDEKIALLEERIEALGKDQTGMAATEKEAIEEEKDNIIAELDELKLAYSVAGRLGKWVEPVTQPAGFDWRTDIALLAGIAAKEAVVSTLGTAWAMGEADPDEAEPLAEKLKSAPDWSQATALALMLFVLLYSPCFVALVVIKQESGSWGWLVFSIIFNTAIAYVVAVIVYQSGLKLLA